MFLVGGGIIMSLPPPSSPIPGGLVASGEGYCLDGGSRQLQLQPGTVWVIHKGVQHSFHTTWKELKVIAYHPETDWGPMDENLGVTFLGRFLGEIYLSFIFLKQRVFCCLLGLGPEQKIATAPFSLDF